VPIGDQPSDIEKQTRMLISEYIAKPNSIILAVSPANVDLVNSEALKLARQVDPMGKRTIGVLTKLDLMDHGTNALDILSGRVYPLKLGFVGVVNRSQQDIQGNKPLADALQTERDFFRHHPAYRNIANRCGTQYLAKTLNSTLMSHIRERLPDIKARLNTLMGQTQQELASYGDAAFTGREHRSSLVLQLMTRFATSFITSIDGTSSEISTKELSGGARIYYIFNSVFGNSLETIDPTQNLSVMDIRTAIRNSTGPRPSLFVPEMAFDLLVKPQIKLLEIPGQRCVELVYEELIKICHTCGSTELSRYPRLQGKLIEVVSDLLRERLGPASSYVESLIAIQRAYINTNHPNFLGAAAAMSSVIQDKQDKEKRFAALEERKKRERRRLKELNGANGIDTPEEEEEPEAAAQPTTLPTRTHHHHKTSRSMSPAVGRGGLPNGAHSSIGAQLAGQQGVTGARDSFLNYFFGQEKGMPGSSALTPGPSLGADRPASRHVSQNIEANFSTSFRQGDNRLHNRPIPEVVQDDLDIGISRHGDFPPLMVSTLLIVSQTEHANKFSALGRTRSASAHGTRSTRDGAYSTLDLFILQYRSRDHCRSSAQGDHAPASQPLEGRRSEPPSQRTVQGEPVRGATVRRRQHQSGEREVREIARYVQGGGKDCWRSVVGVFYSANRRLHLYYIVLRPFVSCSQGLLHVRDADRVFITSRLNLE
jgi:dynamin 1-like protein